MEQVTLPVKGFSGMVACSAALTPGGGCYGQFSEEAEHDVRVIVARVHSSPS